MYLTAQRVVSTTGRRGVNVFRYVHDPVWQGSAVPDEYLPDRNPGALAKQSIEVPAGGNRVLSFLDVVLPDSMSVEEARAFLLALKHLMAPENAADGQRLGSAWARFVEANSLRIPAATELAALAGHLVLRAF